MAGNKEIVMKMAESTSNLWTSPILVALITASTALVVGPATVYVNYLINKQRIRADILNKTRLEWLNEVRLISANLIKLRYEFDKELYKANRKYIRESENMNDIQKQKFLRTIQIEFEDKIYSNYNERTKERELLKLYFPQQRLVKGEYIDNVENIEIINRLDKMNKELNKNRSTYLFQNFRKIKLMESAKGVEIAEFRKKISLYLKYEWEKVEKNK